jgi:hypothetical protein
MISKNKIGLIGAALGAAAMLAGLLIQRILTLKASKSS